MELEDLKTAWGMYDKKIMSAQTITQIANHRGWIYAGHTFRQSI